MTDTALLKYYIDKRRTNQTELAKALNITYQAFNNKVNNKRGFNTDEIYKLSKALGISLEEREKIFFCDYCTQN